MSSDELKLSHKCNIQYENYIYIVARFAKILIKLKNENSFAQFKKIVALSNLIQRIYHNDIRNMLP